jgi:hypothetical protein
MDSCRPCSQGISHHRHNEALNWFNMHLGNGGLGGRAQPVRTFVNGSNAWHASPAWPPSCTEATWYPNDDGLLGTTVSAGGQSKFRFDPSDPTPSVGGRRLGADAGVRDNGIWRQGPMS